MKNKNAYERAFGGANMSFLVSDVISDVYVNKNRFVVIKMDGVWTCYLPVKEKERTLKKGKRIYTNSDRYLKLKNEFEDLINNSRNNFELILYSDEKLLIKFEKFIKLCQRAENYYSYFEYFYTDEIKISENSEKEFGKLKERGRELLNKQYFSENNYLEKLLVEIEKETGVKKETLSCYSIQEIREFLKFGNRLSFNQSEREIFVSFLDKKSKKTLTGSEAKKKIINFLNNYIDNFSELNGMTANKGVVEGKIFVLDEGYNYKDISNIFEMMNEGSILVTETTSPEIIHFCKKALAIVTNQGGFLSHAAIVSRELGIPCIVGVGRATDCLRTGDVIRVDASQKKGVIKIIKRINEKSYNS